MSVNQIPDIDKVYSSANTLRLFIQDNDQISIRKVSNLISDDSELSEQFKVDFAVRKKEFDDFWGSGPTFGIVKPDQPPLRKTDAGKPIFSDQSPQMYSNEEIFRTILYGEISHLNDEKRQRYQGWKKDPFVSAATEQTFAGIMMNIILHLVGFSELFHDAINDESITSE